MRLYSFSPAPVNGKNSAINFKKYLTKQIFYFFLDSCVDNEWCGTCLLTRSLKEVKLQILCYLLPTCNYLPSNSRDIKVAQQKELFISKKYSKGENYE